MRKVPEVTFEFDGAEGIAFWVFQDELDEFIPITFETLETSLVPFLHEWFPGLCEATEAKE